MDNNNIYFTQHKFDEIWGRVTGKADTDADTLKTLMGFEYTDWNIYKTLAQKYTGELRARFLEMAADEKRHFRSLHARYYILTGEHFVPEKPLSITTAPINTVLRDRYGVEREASEGYLGAAEKTQLSDIAELYRANAADEQKHMRIVLALLGNVLK